MGKAKKRKIADFHKPKLKVGKRKPVGTNVTNTAFKTSAINIAAQLEETDDPKNKRNLSMKDLLSHLNHYNVTIRHEALLGFRDLFQRHPETMHQQVNTWLFKVLNKVSDTDAAVRSSLQLCLNHVFGELTSNEIAPFANVVVAHLCCGMTHINEGVQIDTLAILETVLEKHPRLFIPYSRKLLASLTNLICKHSRETSSLQSLNTSKVHKGISKLVNREMSVNIEGKMSSLKVRAKILEKLLNILKVIFNDQLATQNGMEISDNDIISKTIQVNAESEIHVRVLRPELNAQEISFEEWLNFSADNNTAKNGAPIIQFIQDIYPVLLNCWVEYEPGQLTSGLNDSSSVKASLPGMRNIVGILSVFVSLVGSNQENFFVLDGGSFKEFSSHFLHYFALPLTYKRVKNKSIAKQEHTNALQQFAISFNFVMAKYLSQLLLQPPDSQMALNEKLKLRYLKQLGIFFVNVMDCNSFISKDRIDEFLEIFVDVISNLHSKLEKKKWELIQSDFVLSKMVACFSKASVTSPWKMPLLKLFHMICCNRNQCFMQDGFLEQLQLFIKNVIKDVWSYPSTSMELVKSSIHFVKKAAVYQLCNDEQMQSSLEITMVEITDPTHGLYQRLPEAVFKTTVEIIYSMKSLSERLIRNVAYICHKQNISVSLMKYMISIMTLSLQKSTPSIEIEDYTNFVLTVILNYNVNDLKSKNSEKEKSMSWCLLNLYDDGKKELVADHAIKQFESLNGHEQLWNKIMSPIGNFFVMLRQIPVSTAVGLVKLLDKIWEWKQTCREDDDVTHTVNPQINQIADLLSGVLLYTVSERYKTTISMKDIRHENEVEDDLLASAISLLSSHHIILRQLVKKWINIVREYDMDSACVVCIAEVIIALLQEPNLNDTLRDLKSELLSVANIQMNVSIRGEGFSIVQRLKNLLTRMWV